MKKSFSVFNGIANNSVAIIQTLQHSNTIHHSSNAYSAKPPQLELADSY
jgi:hypothetical protein